LFLIVLCHISKYYNKEEIRKKRGRMLRYRWDKGREEGGRKCEMDTVRRREGDARMKGKNRMRV
jgi:hypothetical protein